jgi:hypothetical protein
MKTIQLVIVFDRRDLLPLAIPDATFDSVTGNRHWSQPERYRLDHEDSCACGSSGNHRSAPE